MLSNPTAAGALLRTFRHQRNFTLREASRRVRTSVSSLSRKERGLDPLTRDFLLRVAQSYGLNDWEAGTLFAAAQMLPGPASARAASALPSAPPPDPSPGSLCDFLRDLLAPLPFPAAVVGPLGALRAWNAPLVQTGLLAHADARSPHILDAFLGPRARAALGDQWPAAVERALRTFWVLTQNQALDPAFAALAERLDRTYGAAFRTPWERILAAALEGRTLEGVGALLLPGAPHLPGAPAAYLVVQGEVQARVPLTVIFYLPFGAQSAAAYATGAPPVQAVHFPEDTPCAP